MPTELDAEALLRLWECALGQPPGARSEALLRGSSENMEPDQTLGERNARLVALHEQLFGRELELLSHCPQCGTTAQFSADCAALAAQMRPSAEKAEFHRLEAHGHVVEFCLPSGSDIAGASATVTATKARLTPLAASEATLTDAFTQLLLDRCVLSCTLDGVTVPTQEVPAPVLDALSHQMEMLDPGASVSFALVCPQCATRWPAPLDVGELVWLKVRAAAERVLLDIDVLARAYGWTEREVLRLNPLRRAAYLQMVTS
jgi:hypothetical protein